MVHFAIYPIIILIINILYFQNSYQSLFQNIFRRAGRLIFHFYPRGVFCNPLFELNRDIGAHIVTSQVRPEHKVLYRLPRPQAYDNAFIVCPPYTCATGTVHGRPEAFYADSLTEVYGLVVAGLGSDEQQFYSGVARLQIAQVKDGCLPDTA